MRFLPVLQLLNLEEHEEADSTGQDIKDIDLRNNNCAQIVRTRAEISNRGIGIRTIDISTGVGGRNPGHHYLGHCPCSLLHPAFPAMDEELSAATSYIKDAFFCPVCQEVFKMPMCTMACPHGFCRKCFLTAVRESGIHYPFCHANVTRRERVCPEWALDLENIMRKFCGSYRCCAKQIQFYCMRHH